MKERPFICRGDEVRAILDGRKTQARRIVKPQPTVAIEPQSNYQAMVRGAGLDCCRYGVPGDRMWVRERMAMRGNDYSSMLWCYDADGKPFQNQVIAQRYWKRCVVPSIHMPRWASRITLEITDIRVERLQDISENDAVSEGMQKAENMYDVNGGANAFSSLWESIYGFGTWHANPWVWVVSFRKLDA